MVVNRRAYVFPRSSDSTTAKLSAMPQPLETSLPDIDSDGRQDAEETERHEIRRRSTADCAQVPLGHGFICSLSLDTCADCIVLECSLPSSSAADASSQAVRMCQVVSVAFDSFQPKTAPYVTWSVGTGDGLPVVGYESSPTGKQYKLTAAGNVKGTTYGAKSRRH